MRGPRSASRGPAGRRAEANGQLCPAAQDAGRAPPYGASALPRLGCESARLRLEHPGARLVGASYLLAPGFFHSRVEKSGVDVATRPLVEPDRDVDERLVELLAARYDAARSPS